MTPEKKMAIAITGLATTMGVGAISCERTFAIMDQQDALPPLASQITRQRAVDSLVDGAEALYYVPVDRNDLARVGELKLIWESSGKLPDPEEASKHVIKAQEYLAGDDVLVEGLEDLRIRMFDDEMHKSPESYQLESNSFAWVTETVDRYGESNEAHRWRDLQDEKFIYGGVGLLGVGFLGSSIMLNSVIRMDQERRRSHVPAQTPNSSGLE